MNNKILSVVLVLGIASTGFAAISSANDSSSGALNSEIRLLLEKVRLGETLTEAEQAELDAAKESFSNFKEKRGFDGFGKRAGFAQLTDEEKQALTSMTDEEKKAFFDAKKQEMQVQREAQKQVIDKLIAGEKLTADEEATRLSLLAKTQTQSEQHPSREGVNIIEKLLAWEELTSDEQSQLSEMQAKHAEREAEHAKIEAMSDDERQAYFEAKHAEREAKMEIVKPLMEKFRSGETLSAEEQTTLRENIPERGEFMFGGHGEMRGDMMPDENEAPIDMPEPQ